MQNTCSCKISEIFRKILHMERFILVSHFLLYFLEFDLWQELGSQPFCYVYNRWFDWSQLYIKLHLEPTAKKFINFYDVMARKHHREQHRCFSKSNDYHFNTGISLLGIVTTFDFITKCHWPAPIWPIIPMASIIIMMSNDD